MVLPFFYLSSYEPGATTLDLDEDNSRHIVQVLRMAAGERMQLTDGRGNLLTVVILDAHKKKCRVQVESAITVPPRKNKVTVAISLIKNASRFEWFLEKATEIGVDRILPLLCERTERQHFRQERMQQIITSAMLQSQQQWLPELAAPTAMTELTASIRAGVLADGSMGEQCFIAHCLEEQRTSLAGLVKEGKAGASAGASTSVILIGPEGDFTKKEIDAALERSFIAVTLGETRLRTETAGIVAATLLCTE